MMHNHHNEMSQIKGGECKLQKFTKNTLCRMSSANPTRTQELDEGDDNGDQLSEEEDFLNSQQPHDWILSQKMTEWIKFNLKSKNFPGLAKLAGAHLTMQSMSSL